MKILLSVINTDISQKLRKLIGLWHTLLYVISPACTYK